MHAMSSQALEEKFGMPYPISMATNEARPHPSRRGLHEGDLLARIAPRRGRLHEDARQRLGITPGSVSAMLKRLDELGLITHVPYRGVRLTPAGRRIALEVIRHHRLLESYLAEVLGMPWDRVHDEAEVLEHVLSDDLEAADRGQARQPHRRPARRPDPDRRVRPRRGRDGRARRASDRSGRALRARFGLRPGDAALPRRAGRRASARSSRSSSASRSAARCSCASASARSRSATRWLARCASSCPEEPA